MMAGSRRLRHCSAPGPPPATHLQLAVLVKDVLAKVRAELRGNKRR